jgi:hypothetical protein
MSERRDKAYPENAPGDFYVVCDECIICAAPRYFAPDLIGWSESTSGTGHDHCYFKKQPVTPDEVNRAIKAVWANCCGSYRYAGSDPEIKQKLKDAGCAGAIDND